MSSQKKYSCPCCGYKTHHREDHLWDICEICFWQSDPFENKELCYKGGANGMTLYRAQQNFMDIASCKKAFVSQVRKPKEDEEKDVKWKSISDSEYLKEILICIQREKYKSNKKETVFSKPAANRSITQAEKRLQIKLPQDYILFLKLANGSGELISHTISGMESIEKIDWFRNCEIDTINAYRERGHLFIEDLSSSIVIAGKDHNHKLLLLPPKGDIKKWRYWEFASYFPGERQVDGIINYFETVLDTMKEISTDISHI